MPSTPKRKTRSKVTPAHAGDPPVTDNAHCEASSRAAVVARQEDSDRRAKRVISEFERMGNAFYKDPDDDLLYPTLSTPNTSDTSSIGFDISDPRQDMPLVFNTPIALSKTNPDNLDSVINAQKRIVLIVADNEIADFFHRAVGESPRLSVKKLEALPGQSLIIYAENSGYFADIGSVVNVSIRKSIRRLTLSPEDGKGGTPVLDGPWQSATSRQRIKSAFKRRMVKGMSSNFALPTIALACTAGALIAWLALAFDVKSLILGVVLCALRVVFLVEIVCVQVIRLICLFVQNVLDFIVRHLSALRDQSARVAAGN